MGLRKGSFDVNDLRHGKVFIAVLLRDGNCDLTNVI